MAVRHGSTLVAVDGASRVVTINPGISTMGNDVETYYTFDGSDVFETTLDTDQLLYCDTIYGSDYPADPDDYELDPHYAEIVMKDDDGQWLSNGFLFEPSEPEIFVDAIYDDDNDGFVTVKVATVSTTGIASSTTSVRLNIGEITLNAPTLTLVGLNDEYRTYQLGWVNNTLCKEAYQITASVDDGYSYACTIGERMEAKDRIVVTVSAEGYNDGVLELDELPCEGEKFYRKNAAKAAEGLHDYDFRSDYMDGAVLERARGEYVSRAYIISHSDTTYVGGETVITNDTTWYTREQYLSGEAADATPVYEGYWNWAYDAAKSRTWLDTYTDTLTTDSTEVITPYQLSSGEKQMLAILLTVLVENREPYALLMDEPEISLHIDWQQRLIDLIRQLNPNAQIILSTHSPALIMDGWMDVVTEVNEITN